MTDHVVIYLRYVIWHLRAGAEEDCELMDTLDLLWGRLTQSEQTSVNRTVARVRESPNWQPARLADLLESEIPRDLT